MTTPIFIDSCAWDYLFDNHVVVIDTFPPDIFKIFLTPEVRIELHAIPDFGEKDRSDKRAKKQFIEASISRFDIQTSGNFGFRTYEPDGTPSKVQVNLGFNQGTFQPQEDRDYYADPEVRAHLDGKPLRGSGLRHNQSDASLGARSRRAIVLTNEGKDKPGPLRLAKKKGGHVVYLGDLPASGQTLKEFVLSAHRRWAAAQSMTVPPDADSE